MGALRDHRRFWRWLFWAAAIFAFVMACLPHPPRVPGEPSDKVQHIAAFLALTALASAAYPRTSPLKLLALLSLFGAAIELAQAIPALHRDSDVVDWLADTGATAAMVTFVSWRRKRSAPSGE